MFNQKVNGYWSENPSYVNYSMGAPYVRAEQIHNCGTTIQKFKKNAKCSSLPLQSWCEPNAAVQSFAMRPIMNSKEYFENIKKYLANIVLADSAELKRKGLSKHKFFLFEDHGNEPASSLLQAVNSEVTNKLTFLMADSTDRIKMFSEYNPLSEGFVVTDIDILTYRCTSNTNHFFHKVMFSAVNTTRYNTVTFKASVYQDTTKMMSRWNKAISEVENSHDVTKNINVNSDVYIAQLDLLNNTSCVLGQESDCDFKGYNLGGSFSQLLNDNLLQNPKNVSWLNPESLSNNKYDKYGNYDTDGQIRIFDNGPRDIGKLIKDLNVNN